MPIHLIEKLNKVKKAQRQLTARLGRSPNLAELARETKMTVEQLGDLLGWQQQTTSLNVRIGAKDDTPLLDLLACNRQTPAEIMEAAADRDRVKALLSALPSKERQVLELRFGINEKNSTQLSLQEVANRMNLSRERVRQLATTGLQQVRVIASGAQQ